ncbi:MAG TPA: N-acetylglucosamine kinase [Bacteroidia bacterium]|jgi:glucosamine kinase|nr:N-acetylglucosamine kinase [Bacteroidia bacterium]
MLLIADSGSTKTEWRLVDDNNRIRSFTGQGLNPFFHTSDQLQAILAAEAGSQLQDINPAGLRIFFYGAGCGNEKNIERMRNALESVIAGASIVVETDLLGAARALSHLQPGMVGILGTGMSSCMFDGEQITMQQPSLGFILGDEGSGADLGKRLLKAYLSGDLPPDLKQRMTDRFGLKPAEILHKIYREPFPNRYVASFSKFIYQNIQEQFCVDLVARAFREFFEQHIARYPVYRNQKLSCCGSVAFWFSNILRRVAEEQGQALDKIVENPMAGLCLYHLGENFTVK